MSANFVKTVCNIILISIAYTVHLINSTHEIDINTIQHCFYDVCDFLKVFAKVHPWRDNLSVKAR